MKRGWKVALLLAVLLAAAPAPSCKKETERVELRLRLKGGESYRLRMTTVQKVLQTIQGRRQEMNQTMAVGYRFDVTGVDNGGTASVQITYDSIAFRQEGPMGVIEYDSDNPPPVVPPLARGFAGIVGMGFSMKVTPEGEVLEVDGAEEMLTEMLDQLELPQGPARASIKAILQKEFGDQALQELMNIALAIYPDRPVGIGDSWSRRMVISRGFPMVVENTWTLKSRKDGIAFIEISSEITPGPEGSSIGMGPMELNYEIRGTQTGTIELKEATGWIIRSEVTQSLSGEVRLKTAPEAGGVSWPISVESTITTETL